MNNIFNDDDPRKIEFERLCVELPKQHIPEWVEHDEDAKRIFHKFILDKDNNPIMVEAHICIAWLMLGGEERRFVAKTVINDCEISTVFLTMDWYIVSGDRISVFETMCFSKGTTTIHGRYSTWQEAVAGHKEAVKAITERA